MKKIDLIMLTVTEDGDVFTKVHKQLRDDLGNERLRKILSHMDKVAQIIAESVNGSEGEDENE